MAKSGKAGGSSRRASPASRSPERRRRSTPPEACAGTAKGAVRRQTHGRSPSFKEVRDDLSCCSELHHNSDCSSKKMHASGLYGLAGSGCAVLTLAFMTAPHLVSAICESFLRKCAHQAHRKSRSKKAPFHKGKISFADLRGRSVRGRHRSLFVVVRHTSRRSRRSNGGH